MKIKPFLKTIWFWIESRFFIFLSLIMLFIASSYSLNENLPYGYYQILRFVVCGTSAYFSYKVIKQNRKVWTWILGIIAFLFNPIIPIHLDKETWQFIDFIVAIILFVFLFVSHKKVKEHRSI